MTRAKNKVSGRKDPKKPKRSEIQRNRDMPITANLYLQGHTLSSIASAITKGKKYTLTVQTISKDIKHIEALWAERAVADFNQAKANELAKLDYAEAELWEAWHNSKKPKVTRGKEGTTGKYANKDGEEKKQRTVARGKTFERSEDRDPNPRYMYLILEIVEKRLRIIGAFAPEAHVIASLDLNKLDQERADRWEENKAVMLEALQLSPAIMMPGKDVAVIDAKPKKKSKKK